ncbi:hypothetical protein V8E36_004110 [Tilletia maclaganii]
MANRRRTPFLLLSTVFLVVGAQAAVAAAVTGPLTLPDSPTLASEASTFPAAQSRGGGVADFVLNQVARANGPTGDDELRNGGGGGGHAPTHLQYRSTDADSASVTSSEAKQAHSGSPAISTTGSERNEHDERDVAQAEERGLRENDNGLVHAGRDSLSAHGVSSRSTLKLSRRRKYDGKGTYYRVGMGACGWHNDSNQYVAAISQAQYRGGQHCGKRARVCHGSHCVNVKLVDECPGCNYGSLDLSPAAFRALAPMKIGVIDISWSFA